MSPSPLHLKPYSVLNAPPLIYLISLAVNLAQLVSTSVALPAELVRNFLIQTSGEGLITTNFIGQATNNFAGSAII